MFLYLAEVCSKWQLGVASWGHQDSMQLGMSYIQSNCLWGMPWQFVFFYFVYTSKMLLLRWEEAAYADTSVQNEYLSPEPKETFYRAIVEPK